ncbi:PTS glucose transporter subunit IIA [Caproiciproducens galactitolivorans]|uniref:PTS glucose transporter subunit IIA n=1 Tax=Caproiciproducens galactitolivorans TaxID=642589 RepID=A0ABT4BR79_9FIRM|nr:PTS glucose transporter subunit IIA [Caproiciproducens galactitolivorans]MCY1713404.1 PTS glucose transporter subunit IIA [Caproiciproducens galactitolivorans]
MGLFHKKASEKHSIMAQQTGRVIPLEEVKDPVFSQKVLGDGIAILPESGDVFAPVSGKIVQIADTLHAVCIAGTTALNC